MTKEITARKVAVLGMDLDEWRFESCIAHFGIGDNWATLYDISSEKEGKGHATILLSAAKNYYEKQKKEVGGTIALNSKMSHLYKKIGIKEYKTL